MSCTIDNMDVQDEGTGVSNNYFECSITNTTQIMPRQTTDIERGSDQPLLRTKKEEKNYEKFIRKYCTERFSYFLVVCGLAAIGITIAIYFFKPGSSQLQLHSLGDPKNATNKNLAATNTTTTTTNTTTTSTEPTFTNLELCIDSENGIQHMPGCLIGKNSKLTMISKAIGDFANYKIPCAEHYASFRLVGNFTDDILRYLSNQLRRGVDRDSDKWNPGNPISLPC